MTLTTYDALVQLSEAPDQPLYMKNLAARLLYSASGLTRLVDVLERAGYARRQTDPANRRHFVNHVAGGQCASAYVKR